MLLATYLLFSFVVSILEKQTCQKLAKLTFCHLQSAAENPPRTLLLLENISHTNFKSIVPKVVGAVLKGSSSEAEMQEGRDGHIYTQNLLSTSAVSSINIGSILIFASCVIHRPLVCPTDVVKGNISREL